jgi:acyl transferase domain-containing protein
MIMDLYPDDPEEIRKMTIEQWMRPVEFRRSIEAMYKAGARIFLEVGPKGILTSFADDILRGKDYISIPANLQRRSGITQFNYMIGLLAANGVSMNLTSLYERRAPTLLSLEADKDKRFLNEESEGEITLSLGVPILNIDKYIKEKAQSTTRYKVQPKVSKREENEKTDREEMATHPNVAGSEKQFGEIHSKNDITLYKKSDEAVNPSYQADESSSIMSEYLQTMEKFLSDQEEVMKAFIIDDEKSDVVDDSDL